MVGGARQQQTLLALEPQLCIRMAAGWAMPVATGAVSEDTLLATRAEPAYTAQDWRMAGREIAHGTELVRGHARLEALPIGWSVGAKNRAQA
jgi:hypothetical protein